MPTYGSVTHLHPGKLSGQAQHRVAAPIVSKPAVIKTTRQEVPSGVCLATNGPGGSRKLSQAARDYAAGENLCQRHTA